MENIEKEKNEILVPIEDSIKVQYKVPEISFDATALRAQVLALKTQYTGWIVTEEDIETAKLTVTKLNKLKTAMSDERISIEKKINEPILSFSKEIKDISSSVDELTKSIKDQLDKYEQDRKTKKKKDILASEMWAPYMIFNDAWLNKTFLQKDIDKEIAKQKADHDAEVEKQLAIYRNNVKVVEDFCKEEEIETEKYIKMLDAKRDIADVLASIRNDVSVRAKAIRDAEAKAAEKARLESEAKAKKEEDDRKAAEKARLDAEAKAKKDEDARIAAEKAKNDAKQAPVSPASTVAPRGFDMGGYYGKSSGAPQAQPVKKMEPSVVFVVKCDAKTAKIVREWFDENLIEYEEEEAL